MDYLEKSKARFMKYVSGPDEQGCSLWTGDSDKDGYGRFWFAGKTQRAHRWWYEVNIGPLGDREVIDHLVCNKPSCVTLAHLSPSSNRDNVLRSDIGVTARNSRKTHCDYGHEFTTDNTYTYPDGRGRGCRECSRIWGSLRRAPNRSEQRKSTLKKE